MLVGHILTVWKTLKWLRDMIRPDANKLYGLVLKFLEEARWYSEKYFSPDEIVNGIQEKGYYISQSKEMLSGRISMLFSRRAGSSPVERERSIQSKGRKNTFTYRYKTDKPIQESLFKQLSSAINELGIKVKETYIKFGIKPEDAATAANAFIYVGITQANERFNKTSLSIEETVSGRVWCDQLKESGVILDSLVEATPNQLLSGELLRNFLTL